MQAHCLQALKLAKVGMKHYELGSCRQPDNKLRHGRLENTSSTTNAESSKANQSEKGKASKF
jgi:hypothetical protein